MAKKEEKKVKRKLKLRFKILLFIIIIIVYAFTIGVKFTFKRDYVITTKKLSNKYDNFKILHFSDLHYGSTVKKHDLKNLVKKINETNADIVIFTGDLIDKRYNINDENTDYIKKELSKIEADYGKYYTEGEEDDNDSNNILNISGFVNLSSNEQLIYKDNENYILLINDNSKEYFENHDDNSYKILVTHNPDDFKSLKKYNYDMALCGHTHNGQINIYGIRNLFINTKYKKSYQKIGNTKLYINPGIGTSKINARLFNHPTINLYRFKIN